MKRDWVELVTFFVSGLALGVAAGIYLVEVFGR
jgi:hypothetical protein